MSTHSLSVGYDDQTSPIGDLECRTILVTYWVLTLSTPFSLGIDFIGQTSPVGHLKSRTTQATPRVSTLSTLSSSVNYDDHTSAVGDLECRTILVLY